MPTYHSRRAVLRHGLLAAGALGAGLPLLGTTPMALAGASRLVKSITAADPLAAANLGFAFRIFAALAPATPTATQNTFLSPLSVSIALSMLANGARGATAAAVAKTLGTESLPLPTLNGGSAALIAALAARDPAVSLAVADALWTRKGATVRPAFAQAIAGSYAGQVASLDFADPSSVKVVNGWVNAKTHGLIARIVDGLPADAVLFLINALYFKSTWARPFPSANTTPQPFTLLDGSKKSVPLMSTSGDFAYAQGEGYQAISLPYGSGKMGMVIVLPAPGIGFAAFQKGLTVARWQGYLTSLRVQHGNIALPRFGVSYSAGLIPALRSLGMGPALGPTADFGGIFSDQRATVSQIQHKAVIRVYEAGTEAAAVSGVIMTTAVQANPFSMRVDRPFFCAIVDQTTGIPLFMGSILNPA